MNAVHAIKPWEIATNAKNRYTIKVLNLMIAESAEGPFKVAVIPFGALTGVMTSRYGDKLSADDYPGVEDWKDIAQVFEDSSWAVTIDWTVGAVTFRSKLSKDKKNGAEEMRRMSWQVPDKYT